MKIAPEPQGISDRFAVIDRAIVDALRVDGRATCKAIAQQLSVTTSIVSNRLTRLESEGALRVVAVTNHLARGPRALTIAGIKVRDRDIRAVAHDLAALPEAIAVSIVLGPYDIEVTFALSSHDQTGSFIIDRLGSISGVSAVMPGMVLGVEKSDGGFASS